MIDKDKNTEYALNHMRKMKERHDTHEAFVKRTQAYINRLPYDNYNHCKSFHKWFTKEMVEVNMACWDNDEITILIEEILEREDKYYGEEIQYHRKRLGWQTEEQQDSVEDIHWMEG